jgi:hypothetical protein
MKGYVSAFIATRMEGHVEAFTRWKGIPLLMIEEDLDKFVKFLNFIMNLDHSIFKKLKMPLENILSFLGGVSNRLTLYIH